MKTIATLAIATLLMTGCQSETITEPIAETNGPETNAIETTNPETIETTQVSFNVEGAPTAELEVPDMMCQYSCTAKVKEVLTAQKGVKDVKIDFDHKKAIVAIDQDQFDGEAAVAALVDYQFGNTKLIQNEQN